jgi:type IV pilus assembly protein PilM
MRIRFRSARLTLGLDIGSFSIKAVKLSRAASTLRTVTAVLSGYPRPDVADEDEIIAHVQELLARNGLLKEPASVVLPGNAASVRFFTLPKMPREEFAQAVAWEAAKHAALPSEELITDFIAAAGAPNHPDGQQQVMAAMVPRATVERWVAGLTRIGLSVAAVDIPAMALLARADLDNPWDARGCTALLDLGHSRTGIHLFQNRQLCFTREIAIGGRDLSQALADVLHLDPRQADELKQRFGVSDATAEGEKARQIIEQVLERIAVEVQRSFDYYQAQYRDASFAAVRLCGGSARLPGIGRYFSEALRLEASVDQPWLSAPLDPATRREDGLEELGPVFSAAIGAATRQVGQ